MFLFSLVLRCVWVLFRFCAVVVVALSVQSVGTEPAIYKEKQNLFPPTLCSLRKIESIAAAFCNRRR